MRIDKAKALQLLEEEVKLAQEPMEGQWIRRVERIGEATEDKGKTIIAMLGTALLAKATHIDADPFALKAQLPTKGAYSARSLCQHVLAAHALRLGIDLGVTGREPLNNQPFFGKERVHAGLPVHEKSRPAFDLLLEALEALSMMDDSKQVRLALRAFLHVRRRQRKHQLKSDAGWQLTPSELIEHIQLFVAADSESGKRAQAVTAGLADVWFGLELVMVTKIHDPDRRFPGDVGIKSSPDIPRLEQSIEVRDKPVAATDLYHFAKKAAANGVCKAMVLAVSESQPEFDTSDALAWAEEREVLLLVFVGWKSFVEQCLFWSTGQLPETIQAIYKQVYERCVLLEVSEAGLALWSSVE